MSIDPFGVPENLLGQHDEEFYGAVGRIACLSSLLELQILTAYQTMTNSGQASHTRLGADQLIRVALRDAKQVEDAAAREVLIEYLSSARVLFKRRNDFLHSLWPAQPGKRLFGWRPARAKSTASNLSSSIIPVEITLDDLMDFVHSLVKQIDMRDRVYAAARIEQERLLREGVVP